MLELGAWAWMVLVALVWLAAAPGTAAMTKIRAYRSARRRRRGLGPAVAPKGFVDGAPAVLEGCLETRGTVPRHGDDMPVAAASLVVDDGAGGRVLSHEQAGHLSISTGGASVELQGRLDLQSGSRERHFGLGIRWVPKRVRARLPETAREVEGRFVVRSVAPADRVCIAGSLRRVSAAEDVALYRDAAARWRLVPAHEGGTLPVTPATRPRVSGPAALVWARRSAIALGACAVVVLGGGELAVRTGHDEIAALTPLRRQGALHRLFRRALEETARTRFEDPTLARLAMLPELRDRCDEAVRAIAALDGVVGGSGETTPPGAKHAASLGERCGTPASLSAAGWQWSILGEYARAAKAFRASSTASTARVVAHLATGSPAEAAAALDRIPHLPTAPCIAAALRARSPSALEARNTLAQMVANAGDETRLACGLLYADLVEGRQRIELLDTLPRPVPGSEWDEIVRLLAFEADPTRVVPASERPLPIAATPTSLLYPYGMSLHPSPALAARVVNVLYGRTDAGAGALQARLATQLAMFEAIAGDIPTARMWHGLAADAVRSLPSDGTGPIDQALAPEHLHALAAAIELRGGRFEGASALAALQAPWHSESVRYATRSLESMRSELGVPPPPTATAREVFVRQSGRRLEAMFAKRGWEARRLQRATNGVKALLLDRDAALPLALLTLPSPTLDPTPPYTLLQDLGAASGDVASEVVRRMSQIYALYGRPEAPFFPIGTLAHGRSAVFPFRVEADQCRKFVAIGGAGVDELQLTVETPDGVRWAAATVGDMAIARVCPQSTGGAQVSLFMASGQGAVALQSFPVDVRDR